MNADLVAQRMVEACRKDLMNVTGKALGQMLTAAGLTPSEVAVLMADMLVGAMMLGPDEGREEVLGALVARRLVARQHGAGGAVMRAVAGLGGRA